MAQKLENSEDYNNIFHWAETQKDGAVPSFDLRKNDPYEYQSGFGNNFIGEAVPGTIPRGQNSARVVRLGLYTELISGTSFVAPRHLNKRSWLYRAMPSLAHQGFNELPDNEDVESCFLPSNKRIHVSSSQVAWRPFEIPTSGDIDMIDGIKTVAGSGDPSLREGLAVRMYLCNKSMEKRAFSNSDGDWLIVPQEGNLDIQTEFGMLYVQPGEICVVQKGSRFKVGVEGLSRGYITEVWGTSFQLPELGPLGSNGLANPRDFLHPVAKYEIDNQPWEIINKIGGKLFKANQDHSPFDVVAWHGNYVPYKYELSKFITVGSTSVDHSDPSIFCVLTAPSREPHYSLVDFCLFPPRWDVTSHTFRPPPYHRNVASELVGIIHSEDDGELDGFIPGGILFQNGLVPHGFPYQAFKGAISGEAPVHRISMGTLAFLIESARPLTITDWAWNSKERDTNDPEIWKGFVNNFSSHTSEVEKLLAERKRT